MGLEAQHSKNPSMTHFFKKEESNKNSTILYM